MNKISIIIPVYNAEKYLKQCLDSILKQTFSDFECLCINDGSKDNSLNILEEYAIRDNRIKIINQKNSGSSASRNTGLKHAEGKYITFIDADDWIAENYLEVLYKKIEETDADVVRASYKFYFQEDNSYKSAKVRKIHKITTNSNIERLYKGYAGAFIWSKIYKTSLIKNNNIWFYEERKNSGDCPFSSLVYLYSKKIIFIPDELLFYRRHSSNVTCNFEKNATDDFCNFITLTKDLQKRNFKEAKIKEFCIDVFLYKLGKLGKGISKQTLQKNYSIAIEHMKFLKEMSFDLSFFYKFKIKLSILLLNTFNTFSFKIFRILKNL